MAVSALAEGLTRHWYRVPAGLSPLTPLVPLSALYGAAVGLRRHAYRRGWLTRERAGCPVLVVGNLTVGGTGKTPLTLWLAQALAARGIRAGIVSRGHGRVRHGEAPRAVHPDSPWEQTGDEPLLLAQRSGCPVMVCRDRVAAAQALVAAGCEVVVADDGLQHLRLERDCEVVVIDGARGFGNGRLLPAGPLREPVARLQRADGVVVNGAPAHPSLQGVLPASARFMSLVSGRVQPLTADRESGGRTLASFRGAPVHAVAGIGNPARFFAALQAAGLEVIPHAFADHHPFISEDLAFGNDAVPVLMTEKDAVKCRPFARAGLWVVPVTAQFSDSDAQALLTQVSRKLGIALRTSDNAPT